jgi:hypothetical protein
MSEPSFLDWYPRGRLAFLASKQSNDLKSRIQFAESVASALSVFIKVKSELQATLDAWSFSEKNDDLPSLRLPSAFPISPDPHDLSRAQIPDASRSFLSLTDYLCRFSCEFFSQLSQHPIGQKILEDNPELVSLSGSPILIFDRAIYTIDVGDGIDQLIIESAFPPALVDPDLELEGLSKDLIFVDSIGVTSAVIERDGNVEVFPVVATRPFFSKLSEENKKSILQFLKANTLGLTRLLETQTLIINHLSDYFSSVFESSKHLLKKREVLGSVPVDGVVS